MAANNRQETVETSFCLLRDETFHIHNKFGKKGCMAVPLPSPAPPPTTPLPPTLRFSHKPRRRPLRARRPPCTCRRRGRHRLVGRAGAPVLSGGGMPPLDRQSPIPYPGESLRPSRSVKWLRLAGWIRLLPLWRDLYATGRDAIPASGRGVCRRRTPLRLFGTQRSQSS
jgi:hypothetical protein